MFTPRNTASARDPPRGEVAAVTVAARARRARGARGARGARRGPGRRGRDDLDATFDKIAVAPEAEVLREPITQPSGARDIAVREPAGNRVRIEQG